MLVSIAITFVCVVVGWVLFRAESMGDAGTMLSGMVGSNGVSLPPQLGGVLGSLKGMGVEFQGFGALQDIAIPWILLVFAIAFTMPNTQELLAWSNPALEPVEERRFQVAIDASERLCHWRSAAFVRARAVGRPTE